MKVALWMAGIGMWVMAASSFAACCGGCGMGGAAPVAEKDEAKAPVKAQMLCPITGKEIDKKQFVDYQGKRVYFSSANCPTEFNKDPGKYIKKMEDDGITLERLQTKCPVMGGDIDRTLFADYQGQRVYFCCGMCSPKFSAAPRRYLAAMAKGGVALEKTPATER